MVALWRVASDTPNWTAEDLQGKGAAVKGARWNHPGERVTYASTSIALAAWETRAHSGRGVELPRNRFLVRIDVPDDVWKHRAAPDLTRVVGWDAIPEGSVSRRLGSAWLAEAASALCLVPSVVVAEEHNVLINPVHPAHSRLRATKLRRFLYDPRV